MFQLGNKNFFFSNKQNILTKDMYDDIYNDI